MDPPISLIHFLILSIAGKVISRHEAPQIETSFGPVQGIVSQYRGVNVLEYKGIPYAKAPINANRFLLPEEPDPWLIPIDASEYGPACIQQVR